MGSIRRLIRDYRTLAMIFMAVVLLAKILVPQGFMPGSGVKTLTVQLCFDGTEPRTVDIAIPVDGKAGQGKPAHDAKPNEHCPYTSLTMASHGGADAPLLALALAFILLLGFAPVAALPSRPFFYARPPLRGPPAAI